eukprot:1160414-Pelagomonas_calceolata.AAC.8
MGVKDHCLALGAPQPADLQTGRPSRSPIFRHAQSQELPPVQGTLYDMFFASVARNPNNECGLMWSVCLQSSCCVLTHSGKQAAYCT